IGIGIVNLQVYPLQGSGADAFFHVLYGYSDLLIRPHRIDVGEVQPSTVRLNRVLLACFIMAFERSKIRLLITQAILNGPVIVLGFPVITRVISKSFYRLINEIIVR